MSNRRADQKQHNAAKRAEQAARAESAAIGHALLALPQEERIATLQAQAQREALRDGDDVRCACGGTMHCGLIQRGARRSYRVYCDRCGGEGLTASAP